MPKLLPITSYREEVIFKADTKYHWRFDTRPQELEAVKDSIDTYLANDRRWTCCTECMNPVDSLAEGRRHENCVYNAKQGE